MSSFTVVLYFYDYASAWVLQCKNNQVKQCWTPWTESVLLPETLTLQDYIPFLFKIILIKATRQSWWEWVGASRPCLTVYSWFSVTVSGVWCWPFLCNFSRLITIETLEHEWHEEHAPILCSHAAACKSLWFFSELNPINCFDSLQPDLIRVYISLDHQFKVE